MSIKVALIGYGYWGPNLLRNLFENPNCEVVYCCDLTEERLNLAKRRYPSIKVTTDINQVLDDKKIKAMLLAIPTRFHYPIAKKALLAGKHVLIEKPMTINHNEAVELVELAEKKKLILMVDHTFLFNDAVVKMKQIIDRGELGKILYIDSVRANLGLFQPDVNVIYDLASHDFSIIQYLLGKKPKFIKVEGKANYNKQADVAYIRAQYSKNILAHVHVSWLSPVKIRRMMVVGTEKMVVYDDTEPAEKVKIYDKGIILEGDSELVKINYRTGDIWLPKIDDIEALSYMIESFIDSIMHKKQNKSSGKFCADIVETLESASQSLKIGRKINL